jgi:hypothetical protein
MRAFVSLLVLAVSSCSSLPRPWGEGVDLSTQMLGGYRVMIDHPEHDGHPVVGLELASVERARGVGYEIGGLYGTEDEGGARNAEAEIDEVYFGLRRNFGDGGRTFLATGVSWSRVETFLDDPTVNFDDDSLGAYLHGGVLWKLTRIELERGLDVNLGLDGRLVVGDEVDLGQLALVLSFGG